MPPKKKTKKKYDNRKRMEEAEPVYEFDIEGNFVRQYASVAEVANRYRITAGVVRNSISRKACYRAAFYFSHSRNFQVPDDQKYSHNPLLGKKNIAGFKNADEAFRHDADLDDDDDY